ncbi:MAG: hypothetical protein G3M78_04180 [Candidatus Nitrohelix vancouverensis]|uniref:Uncharacterized protein n=1 Tax=Candidatus Nitrohelix vancouverensis TaxID=2705534 RepID=A0A7T0C142_9BACT|nr:MAG: hypothetical protein G3M78_04180 [Candidatus Nitrohelix vancouverensis]
MHTVYKALSEADVQRIVALCRKYSVKNGGVFEIYSQGQTDAFTVIVNTCKGKQNNPRVPVGIFYINHVSPGIVSLEDEDPKYDAVEAASGHVQTLKRIIDLLVEDKDSKLDFTNLEIEKGRSAL